MLTIDKLLLSRFKEVNKLLESVFLDVNFSDNSDLIGISFHDEEIVNVSKLSQIIIDLGYKIVVDSNELYHKLVKRLHIISQLLHVPSMRGV